MTFAALLVAGPAAGYTGTMNDRFRQAARELTANPLAWASYAAWTAVWMAVSAVYGRPEAGFPATADLLLFAWLLVWIICLLDEFTPTFVDHAALVGLTALTALAIWIIPAGSGAGTTPILMILLATQFTARLPARWLVAALVAVNLYFFGVMLGPWQVSFENAALTLLGIGAFQLFAVMVMLYARKAEQMAEDLKAVNARLLATRSLLGETARDQERLRLSRELHDVAGHKLTALKLNLRGLARRLDDESAREINQATGLATELLDDLRAVVRHLRATEGIDLAASLREVARPFPRPRIKLDLDEHARIPHADQAEALLRVVQEGLTNAARHGPAKTLEVHLKRRDNRLLLSVEDDGRVSVPVRAGNGLTGMRERLEALHGSLELSRSSLGGLKLTASLPMEPPE